MRKRNRLTTFGEFIQHCHDLLWKPLRAEVRSRSTTGTIPPPTGKYCPLRLRPWTYCAARQRGIYASVCRYLQPTEVNARQLFTPVVALEDYGRRFAHRPNSSEQDLETYERLAVEELSTKIPFFSFMSFKERAGVGLLAYDCGEGYSSAAPALGYQILGRLLD